MQEGANNSGELNEKEDLPAIVQIVLQHIEDDNSSRSTSPFSAAGNEIIGIDLGTTNSCVAVLEGKVKNKILSRLSAARRHI